MLVSTDRAWAVRVAGRPGREYWSSLSAGEQSAGRLGGGLQGVAGNRQEAVQHRRGGAPRSPPHTRLVRLTWSRSGPIKPALRVEPGARVLLSLKLRAQRGGDGREAARRCAARTFSR